MLDDATKERIEKSIKKAFYLCFQGLEKNINQPTFYIALIEKSILSAMFMLVERFPSMQSIFTRTMFTPIKYCDNIRRSVDHHGHDDYSKPQPHVVDCEQCNCSILQLLFLHSSKMTGKAQSQLLNFMALLSACEYFKGKLATDYFENFRLFFS